jgi:hypothetical protein
MIFLSLVVRLLEVCSLPTRRVPALVVLEYLETELVYDAELYLERVS